MILDIISDLFSYAIVDLIFPSREQKSKMPKWIRVTSATIRYGLLLILIAFVGYMLLPD